MTVCIAAIAENGDKIVLATDNGALIPLNSSLSIIRKDDKHKKIFKINTTIYALYSGVPDYIQSIMVDQKSLLLKSRSPQEAADNIRNSLYGIRQNFVENIILKPHNLTWETYHGGKITNQELNKMLIEKISTLPLDAEVIIAGFDPASTKPYFALVGPLGFQERTFENFLVIGAGRALAIPSLISHKYDPSLAGDIVSALAKQAIIDAGMVPGVGDLGELKIICPEVSPTGNAHADGEQRG